jgi:hypothetical protein
MGGWVGNESETRFRDDYLPPIAVSFDSVLSYLVHIRNSKEFGEVFGSKRAPANVLVCSGFYALQLPVYYSIRFIIL